MEDTLTEQTQIHVKNLVELKDRLIHDKIVPIKKQPELIRIIATYIESTQQYTMPLFS